MLQNDNAPRARRASTQGRLFMARFVLMAVAAAALAGSPAAAAERQIVEAILIRVNDRVVTVSDFRDRLQQEVAQLAEQPSGPDLRVFTDRLFDGIVDEMVLQERAEEKRMTVTDEEVDRALVGLREENSLQEDAAFEAALGEAGLTVDDLRERYRQSMLLQRVAQSEIKPTEITEEEVRQIYEAEIETYKVPKKVHLEQLFFETEDAKDHDQVLARAQGIVERVRGGADLKAEATLAGVELQDVGEIPEEDLRPDRRQAIADLGDGELSDPNEAIGGFLVLRVVERIPEGYTPFEEVKGELRRRESMKVYEEQSRGLVENLKKNYLVEIHRERMAIVLEGLEDG